MYTKSDLSDLKHIDPETLASHNLLTTGKKNGYECPYCGNGTGEDGTGVEIQLLQDGYKGYCFKCHKYFDVFDLIAEKERFNVTTQFVDVANRAREIFGKPPAQTKTAKQPEKKVENFSAFIKATIARLDSFFAGKKTFRGLLKNELKKFGCGYEPKWFHAGTRTERIIIPTSVNHYLARYVGQAEIDKSLQKIHRGHKEIFGMKNALKTLQEKPETLIFAVEGEFDAMSIDQCGYTAIAFSGSDVSALQQTLLKQFPKESAFILMLDSDETGRKNSEKVAAKIRKLGFPLCIKFLDEQYADANDFLQLNELALKNELKRIYQEAQTYLKENPPLPVGIIPSGVEGVNEITSAYKPPNPLDKTSETFEGIQEPQNTQDVIRNCPINLQVPTNFLFKPKGIYHIEKIKGKGKDAEEKTVEILDSSTPIVPTRILQKKDRSDKSLELAYYERAKNKWHKITAPATTIAKTQNITDLAGLGVDVNTPHARSMSEFLMKIQHAGDNAKLIPQAVVFEQPGWSDKNCAKFIYPPEGIIDGENYVVQNNGFEYEEKFSSAGTKEDWYGVFVLAYSPREYWWARYATGLALAAPLVAPCNSRNWQGVLVSPSGSGKSAVAKLAVSIFGNPEKYHTTFNGTNNFSDELAARLNDLPCWIDEFQAADKKTREDFQNFIYNYAEQKTRGRLSRNAEMKKQYEFRGTRLCTSEQAVLQEHYMQGAFNRVIQIQGFQPFKDGVGRALHEDLKLHYGHYGKMWIDYVAAHREEILETFKAVQVKYRPMNFIPHHLQHIALVYTALEYFYRMLREDRRKAEADGVKEAEWLEFPSPLTMLEGRYDKKMKIKGDIEFFRELLPTPQESNNVIRALDFLGEARFSQKARFYHQEGSAWGSPTSNDRNGALGYLFSNGDVGFMPRPLSQYLLDNGYPPAKDLMRGFCEQGLIKVGGGELAKRFQNSVKIEKASVKMYYFPKKSFDEPLDNGEEKS